MRRYSGARLAAWFVVVGALAILNYAVRFTGAGDRGDRDALYSYSAAVSGAVFYTVFFAFVYAIASVDSRNLFALRKARSRKLAIAAALAVFGGIYLWSLVVSQLPLPQSPGEEQGVTPEHWDPSRAGAYAANFVVIAIAAPIVEELTFRGVGFALLREYGLPLAIVGSSVGWGLAHGLLAALIVLVPFGMALAWLRERTDSVYPCIGVHAAFNAAALLYVLTT